MKDVQLVLFKLIQLQDIDFIKRGTYSIHIRKFFLIPEFWTDSTNDIDIEPSNWKSVKFTKSNKSKVPESKGLYAFIMKPSYPSFLETRYLFYVGKTTRTLQIRFDEYFQERDGTGKYRYLVREMLKLYDGNLYFYYIEMGDNDSISECEEKLLNTFVPYVNTDIPDAKINPDLRNIYKAN